MWSISPHLRHTDTTIRSGREPTFRAACRAKKHRNSTHDLKKILFVDTGREYGDGTKNFLYLLRGLAAQQKYELCAFFETDYEAGGRKISQIIEEDGTKFIKFEPKKQPSKLKKGCLAG